MKPISHTITLLVALLMALGGNVTQGAVTATLDRDKVSLGDSLRLTISATEDEELDDADLRALLDDFEILQRSTSSNTSIVNGRLSRTRQVIIELAPTRQGKLQIPSMQFGKSTTASLPVVVGAAPATHAGDQTVLFEAEVDQRNVYVQGQIILTLRVQQAVNLEGRGISELKLDNAFVKPLEQRSFQRTIDGRQWLVDELRYAIFPEQSGTLEIPAQVFSGRLERGRRSFSNPGSGELVRRSAEAISINVLPKPDSFTADTWLPSRHLTLEENWSTSPEQMRVGESATRTIRIQGEGLQGAQLPPILFAPADGLKYYPDQPQISEQEIPNGLLGIRQDSAAVVPTRAGTLLIPEIRIPWWDTQSEQVQYAVLPEREITVTAAEPTNTPADATTPSPAIEITPGAAVSTAVPAASQHVRTPVWQILSAVSTVGWLTTLFYLWRRRDSGRKEPSILLDNTSETEAFKRLLAACSKGDAVGARSAVITWATTLKPSIPALSLEQVAIQLQDEEFTRELNLLDARLYSPDQGNWTGATLADCARRLRGQYRRGSTHTTEQLRLYPSASS